MRGPAFQLSPIQCVRAPQLLTSGFAPVVLPILKRKLAV